MEEQKIIFIISYVYNINYTNYINHYIDNINQFYKNASILIVDNLPNNNDKFNITPYPNVTIIQNNTSCKYEIGAYRVGLNYLITNSMVYDYYIFTQENLIIKNKYDFNNLVSNNIKACTIYSYHYDYNHDELCKEILEKLDMYNYLDKITFCWCNSFILHQSVIETFLSITKDIILTTKRESEASERYLARILYELNDHQNFDIDGNMKYRKYDCWTVNLLAPISNHYFVKRVQQRAI